MEPTDIYVVQSEIEMLNINKLGSIEFEQTTLTIDDDLHLQLVYFATKDETKDAILFQKWLAKYKIPAAYSFNRLVKI